MERLSAALSVAGHARAAGGLALPPVVLADITSLLKEHKRRVQEMQGLKHISHHYYYYQQQVPGLLFHLSHEQSKPSCLTAIKMNYCDCGAAEMKHSSTRVQLQLLCRWLGSFSCQDNRWGFQTEHSFYRETVDQMFGDVVKKVDTDRPANCSESASKQTLRLEFSASR